MVVASKTGLDVQSLLPNNSHFIGGAWVAAQGGESLTVMNPATQETLANVPRGREADVDAAVRAAQAAFPAWRDTNPTVRANLLRRWAALLDEHSDEIAMIESLEVGKPYHGGMQFGAGVLYTAGLADKIQGATLPSARPDQLGFTLREPFGVCGSIVPWNFPAHLMLGDAAPALAAGNTLVVKPPEDAPLAVLYVAKLAQLAGIPDGVLNVVTGYGPEAGAPLPSHPLVRHMSFTGSPETGSVIMALCAKNLIPLHLELGGKSPQIVLRDAPLDKAVNTIVRSVTANTGQICVAGTRVIVEEQLHSDLVGAVAAAMEKVRVGPWYENVDMGPLISAKQEKRVLGYLDIGQQEGARVVTGGHKMSGEQFDRGFFIEPTLFDQVAPTMRIAQEEIFGPVLSVLGFTDADQAIEVANNTRYGLGAAVWTTDVRKAVQIAKGVQSGQVYINTYGTGGVIGAPFGGYKNSGFGRTGGVDALLEYTQVKTVVIDAGL